MSAARAPESQIAMRLFFRARSNKPEPDRDGNTWGLGWLRQGKGRHCLSIDPSGLFVKTRTDPNQSRSAASPKQSVAQKDRRIFEHGRLVDDNAVVQAALLNARCVHPSVALIRQTFKQIVMKVETIRKDKHELIRFSCSAT
jgi:hypothetical protein